MNNHLQNIEFFNTPEGEVMICGEQGVHTYTPADHEITAELFQRIEEDYPEAFKALSEKYRKSAPNVPYFRFKVCQGFIKCNFGQYDSRKDVNTAGRFTLEEVACPLRGECKWENVICRAKFNTNLTPRQKEVMRLYMDNLSAEDIADRLYITVETVKTTKRNALQRVGVTSLAEFVSKFKGLI